MNIDSLFRPNRTCTRRRAIQAGALLGLGPLAQRLLPQSPSKPNVVFVLADDLGWSDTGTFGSDLVQTPNLDRFNRSGVKFTRAYSAASVCSPTRASFLTGKYPARLHMTTWYESAEAPPKNRKLMPPIAVADLPLSEKTIAELMHDAGYVTAHVGKWHLGSAGFYPENQGFDVNIGGTFCGAPRKHTSTRIEALDTTAAKTPRSMSGIRKARRVSCRSFDR